MDFNSSLVPHNKAQLLCLIMQIFIKENAQSGFWHVTSNQLALLKFAL